MAEEPPLERLKSVFDLIRERANYALQVIAEFEQVRSLRWRCLVCGNVRGFTRRVPIEVAIPCPKCRSSNFIKD
jgi:Zn finger protein HypA/HybF involved in hydrogenase expression